MKSCYVKLKDGREIRGAVWNWKPTEGWMSIAGDDDGPDVIMFEDIAEGTMERPLASVQEAKVLDGVAKALGGVPSNPVESILDYARASGWKQS
mgnify:CR=1 FL=1